MPINLKFTVELYLASPPPPHTHLNVGVGTLVSYGRDQEIRYRLECTSVQSQVGPPEWVWLETKKVSWSRVLCLLLSSFYH